MSCQSLPHQSISHVQRHIASATLVTLTLNTPAPPRPIDNPPTLLLPPRVSHSPPVPGLLLPLARLSAHAGVPLLVVEPLEVPLLLLPSSRLQVQQAAAQATPRQRESKNGTRNGEDIVKRLQYQRGSDTPLLQPRQNWSGCRWACRLPTL